jgi:hypothetical protein
MVFLLCLLTGPLIGWNLYGGWQGAAMGAGAGAVLGGLLQIVALVATIRSAGRKRWWIAPLIALPGIAAMTVLLKPPPPAELFEMVTEFAPPAGVSEIRAGWDWNRDARGYYFGFAADEAGLLEIVRKLDLAAADAFSDTPPTGAPSWWIPARGEGSRAWTRTDARRMVELSALGPRASLLVRVR